MKGYKGFDKDLRCRDMQFEIGKEYKLEGKGEVKCCTDSAIHFCKDIEQVHDFYEINEYHRFCEVEALGDVDLNHDKCGTNRIRIVREIKGQELDVLVGKTKGNTGLFNTGYRNTGYCNTGDRNTGNHNTGDWNTGYCNTGDHNTGDRNTGYCNTGNHNTGYCNTGNRNTGYCNTGYRNTGYCNTGNWNTGDWNTGDFNTGDWNTCDRSTGLFNTEERTISIFNVDSGLTYAEASQTDWFHLVNRPSFELTEWINYTDEEKKVSIIKRCIGGYLKEYTFYEACEIWWENFNDEEKEIIQTIPNFDAFIFEEITGIKIIK